MKSASNAARLLLVAATAGAIAFSAEETPKSIPGGKMISVEKAKEHFGKGALFIDTRVVAEYAEKHIKGAKSIVFKEVFVKVSKTDPKDSFDMKKLPQDKHTPIIFYCNGSPCWKGYKAAVWAIKAGYTDVMWFRDGLPAWVAQGHPVE